MKTLLALAVLALAGCATPETLPQVQFAPDQNAPIPAYVPAK
jgi:hypothetical protein